MPERDRATDAVSALAALAGAWCVRVHDVRRQPRRRRGGPCLGPWVRVDAREALAVGLPAGLDRIAVLGITGTGFHGVFEHEKRDGQTFVVDVTLAVRHPGGRSDRRPRAHRRTTARSPPPWSR